MLDFLKAQIFTLEFSKLLLIALGIAAVLKIFEKFLAHRFKKLAEESENKWDDMIVDVLDSFGILFYVSAAIFIGNRASPQPTEIVNEIINKAFLVIAVYYGGKMVTVIINNLFKRVSEDESIKDQIYDPSIFKVVNKLINAVVWIAAFLLILQNFGFKITTLLGGLGIMGIALAFGVQTILEDIFSVFSIYMDKPFKSGDFIMIGDDMGTVKKIGIKSTRVKTLQGEELVVSNKELTAARINNFGRMRQRRVVFEFGVTYDTSPKKLKKIPEIVEKAIKSKDKTEFSRAHFREFGASSLVYEVVYMLKDKDYNIYMNTQQAINLEILTEFEKEKIEMAFPTRTVYLKK